MRVLDQFRQCGGPRGEVQQQRVAGEGGAVQLQLLVIVRGVLVLDPAENGRADGDPDEGALHPTERRRVDRPSHHEPGAAATHRSCRSGVFSRVLAGMMTAPSLMQARITSHNST